MNKQNQKLIKFLVALATIISATSSRASLVGEIWENNPNPGDASIVPPDGLPYAQFSSPSINYQINNSDSTSIATFLNNPVFFNQANGFNSADNADNTFIRLTGQIFLNAGVNSFVVAHDDGVVLFVDGVKVVNAPGPTSEDFTPFDVTAAVAGNHNLVLYYTECCGGPADLVLNVNQKSVPVGRAPDAGSTFPLMGLAVGGLAAFARWIRR